MAWAQVPRVNVVYTLLAIATVISAAVAAYAPTHAPTLFVTTIALIVTLAFAPFLFRRLNDVPDVIVVMAMAGLTSSAVLSKYVSVEYSYGVTTATLLMVWLDTMEMIRHTRQHS